MVNIVVQKQKMTNSVDPDEMAHRSRLFRICTVFKTIFLVCGVERVNLTSLKLIFHCIVTEIIAKGSKTKQQSSDKIENDKQCRSRFDGSNEPSLQDLHCLQNHFSGLWS